MGMIAEKAHGRGTDGAAIVRRAVEAAYRTATAFLT
jgi:hypothetical protein